MVDNKLLQNASTNNSQSVLFTFMSMTVLYVRSTNCLQDIALIFRYYSKEDGICKSAMIIYVYTCTYVYIRYHFQQFVLYILQDYLINSLSSNLISHYISVYPFHFLGINVA